MDIKNYRIYWREFSGYLGEKMGKKNSVGIWEYGNFDLFKFGYEEVGKDRVEMNDKYETENKWKDLWRIIKLRDFVEFECTLESIKHIEGEVKKYMGKKDFWMQEQVSGITEFMLASRKKEVEAEQVFKYLRELQDIYNKEKRPQSVF